MLVCHTGKWTTINVEPYTAFGIKHAHAQTDGILPCSHIH